MGDYYRRKSADMANVPVWLATNTLRSTFQGQKPKATRLRVLKSNSAEAVFGKTAVAQTMSISPAKMSPCTARDLADTRKGVDLERGDCPDRLMRRQHHLCP